MALKQGKQWEFGVLLIIPILFFIIFHYIPMYGVIIAFKDFSPARGILGSDWVGFYQFKSFFESFQFKRVISNTLTLSFLNLATFPIPIILALLLNQAKSKLFKKTTQIITYAPHFISMVVLAGIVVILLSPETGLINVLLKKLGKESIFFMGDPALFKGVFTVSGIWQETGWGTVIYLAALAAIDPALYEAGRIEGAGRGALIRYIDIPSLMPTVLILLILRLGRIMDVAFQKAYLLQNSLNIPGSETIQTYAYKTGLIQNDFSYSTAISLFNTSINILLLIFANKMSKKITKTSLW